MKTILIEPLVHRNEAAIALRFENDFAIREKIKTLKDVSYSATHQCFYIFEKYTSRHKLYK